MPALALALALSLSATGRGHAAWLKSYVLADSPPATPEGRFIEEQDARGHANSAWRDGEQDKVDALRKTLEQFLADSARPDPVRGRAARVLGWMRQPESVAPLSAALEQGPVKVREEAANALRFFGAHEVRFNVMNAMGTMIVERLEPTTEPAATAALVQATRGAEARVRRAALRSLALHEGPEVTAAAMEAAREVRDGVETIPLLVRAEPAALEALLLAYSKSAEPNNRSAGARGIGAARLDSARPRLLELLDDPVPSVFAAAHEALRELEGFPAADLPEEVALDRAVLTAGWKAKRH